MRLLGYVVVTMVAAFAVVVLLAGCQRDKPATGRSSTQTKAQETTPTKPEAMSMPMQHEAMPAPAEQTAQVAEQTTCPVMGGPIDKNIFVEYKGKKVYFCCNGCPATFLADPEKYISKLPQFAR
jgi:YHS domain-containing protein